jgi:hypothetical protein
MNIRLGSDNAASAVVGVCESLASQLPLVGHLNRPPAGADQPERAFLSDHLLEQVACLRSLTEVLEQVAGLRLESDRVPFIYYSAPLPADAPLAGISARASAIPPSILINSYYMTWNVQWDLRRRSREVSTRVLTAGLWMIYHHGWYEAVEYLLRLVEFGFVTSYDSAPQIAMTAISRAVNRGIGPREFVSSCYGGGVPTTQQEWIHRDFEFVMPEGSDDQAVVEAVLTRLITKFEECRSAESFADWVAHYYSLNSLFDQFFAVLHKAYGGKPYSDPTLVFLEEVRADCGSAFGMLLRGYYDILQPKDILGYMDTIRMILLGHDPVSGYQRFLDERWVFPPALAPQAGTGADTSAGQLSGPWRALSPDATLLTYLSTRDGLPWFLPLDSREPTLDPEEMMALFRRLSEHSSSPADRVRELRPYSERHPWNPFLYHELAIAYDESGDLGRAAESIRSAVALNPLYPHVWTSLAVIAGRQGNASDNRLGHMIAYMLNERESRRNDQAT